MFNIDKFSSDSTTVCQPKFESKKKNRGHIWLHTLIHLAYSRHSAEDFLTGHHQRHVKQPNELGIAASCNFKIIQEN